MAHLTMDELADMLAMAKTKVIIGGQYAHYKHPDQLYRVTGLSILEATDEVAVKYAPVDNPEVEFVRSLTGWLQTVDWNGQAVPRFTEVAVNS